MKLNKDFTNTNKNFPPEKTILKTSLPEALALSSSRITDKGTESLPCFIILAPAQDMRLGWPLRKKDRFIGLSTLGRASTVFTWF